MIKINKNLNTFIKNTEEIISTNELKKKLLLKKKLTIKIGFDPTSPDIHLGHTILLNKAQIFQEKGHNITIIIGDFTGMIGDPSGKNNTRIQLTKEEVQENAKTYKEQIFKILKEKNTKILFNSSWLNKITPENLIKLISKQTVAKMLQREDFNKRYNKNKTIYIHEFLYPIIQAYDSIIINADLELGGNDQKFNLLMGRMLQKQYKQNPQCIMMLPLLEGINGINKMSKSLKNYININDSPENMFGKLMSISDDLMYKYTNLLLNFKNIDKIKHSTTNNQNPKDHKINLAFNIVKKYHGYFQANTTKHNFIIKFSNKNLINIKNHYIKINEPNININILLKKINFTRNISESINIIKQKSLKINNEIITNTNLIINKNTTITIKLGKKIENIYIY